MCGIIGYIGGRNVGDEIIEGLTKLEYRGYDSAGMCNFDAKKKVSIFKEVGKVSELAKSYSISKSDSVMGIGHTRWATHGAPTKSNAHPHTDNDSSVFVVHNGVIENYRELKDMLTIEGYVFYSDTDSEVIPNLIHHYKKSGLSLFESILATCKSLVGAYGLAIISVEEDCIYAVKNGSPLVLGIGKDEMYISSDEIPLIGKVGQVLYLRDGDIAKVGSNTYQVFDFDKEIFEREIAEVAKDSEQISKSGYDYFMEKEIFEQKTSLIDSMRGRINKDRYEIVFGGLTDNWGRIMSARRVVFLACGTSYHAGMVGAYTFESLARVPSKAEYASEFLYRNPIVEKDTLYVAVSQSGETKDLISAVEYIKAREGIVMGLVNVVGSTLSRMTDFGIHIHAGPEIGVASTKAFTSQVLLISMLATKIAEENGSISKDEYLHIKNEILSVPNKIEQVLKCDLDIQKLAEEHKGKNNVLFLGRGTDHPTALEAALKLKEVSYIHAEGYPAAELKHGVIALIDKDMPSIVLATLGANQTKVLGNIEEINARGGEIIIISDDVTKMFDHIPHTRIHIPATHKILTPILSVVPLQLYAFYSAIERGTNVDQPRNLAKSVTVE